MWLDASSCHLLAAGKTMAWLLAGRVVCKDAKDCHHFKKRGLKLSENRLGYFLVQSIIADSTKGVQMPTSTTLHAAALAQSQVINQAKTIQRPSSTPCTMSNRCGFKLFNCCRLHSTSSYQVTELDKRGNTQVQLRL